jgi:general secretion pathway protein K
VTAASRERGVALVAVLWIAMLLSLIATVMITTGRADRQTARNSADRARLEAIADAGVARAILGLLAQQPEQRWEVARPYRFAFAGADVAVTIQDELGRIDLNAAPDELLQGLLVSNGLSVGAAQAIVDKIADWRDPDNLVRLHGAEAPNYRNAGYVYGPRNGPFPTIDELSLVMGVTPELFARIAPALTIHTGASAVDPTVAPVEVLKALPAVTPDRLDAILKERAKLSGNFGTVGVTGFSDVSRIGRAFAVSAEVASNGARFRREAVIRLTGDPRRPYWIHHWQEASSR